MINRQQVIERLKYFIIKEFDSLTVGNPIICFIKPIAIRVIDKKLETLDRNLNLITNQDGNIDIEGIINEISDSLIKSKSFKLNIPVLGDISIGEGKIEIPVPIVGKNIIFSDQDLKLLKETLMEN